MPTRTTQTPEKPHLSSRELDAMGRTQAELLSELWILRDRVLLLEHLLVEAGILKKQQLDNFQPPESLEAQLKTDRDALVARVIGAGHRESFSVAELRSRAGQES